jgi:hypothetical protein
MPEENIIQNIMAGAVGGLVAILAGHFLTKDRERQRDKKAAKQAALDAKSAKRQEFLNLVIEVKSQIEMENDPNVWINHFTDHVVPGLLSEFRKISKDWGRPEKGQMETFVLILVEYSKRNGAIYMKTKMAFLKFLKNCPKVSLWRLSCPEGTITPM